MAVLSMMAINISSHEIVGILMFLGWQMFWDWAPKFPTEFVNQCHHRSSNMLQSLMTIDRTASEIRWINK